MSDSVPTGIPKGFLETRKLLYNLCLTSKWAYQWARPLLYRTIIFLLNYRHGNSKSKLAHNRSYGDIVTLVLLIRTLLEKPEIRGLIKNILCLTRLSGERWWRGQEHNHDLRRWPFVMYNYPPWESFSERDARIFRGTDLAPFNFANYDDSKLGARLLAVLFWYTPNLKHLLLTGATYRSLFSYIVLVTSALKELPMPRLSTLRIQREHIGEAGIDYDLRLFILLQLNVTRLHLSCDLNCVFSGLGFVHRSPFPMQRIRELKLVGSSRSHLKLFCSLSSVSRGTLCFQLLGLYGHERERFPFLLPFLVLLFFPPSLSYSVAFAVIKTKPLLSEDGVADSRRHSSRY